MKTGVTPVKNAVLRIPVPTDWPEQKVEIISQELPEGSKMTWEEVGNVKMLQLELKQFPANQKTTGQMTFQVSTKQIIAPKDTSSLHIPEKRTKEIRDYLAASPGISSRDSKLRKIAKSLFEVEQSDWVKIGSLLDWVRDNVEERTVEFSGAVNTFRNKFGSSEDRTALFVALCRANKVPARMVYCNQGHYAEFYLLDGKEVGHWFPCRVSGFREFGHLDEPTLIIQKGDNYRVPWQRERLRFIPGTGETQVLKSAKATTIERPAMAFVSGVAK